MKIKKPSLPENLAEEELSILDDNGSVQLKSFTGKMTDSMVARTVDVGECLFEFLEHKLHQII
jgi:hypothetical protein